MKLTQTPNTGKIALVATIFATSLLLSGCTLGQQASTTPEPTSPVAIVEKPPIITESAGSGEQNTLSDSANSAGNSEASGILDPTTNMRTIEIEAGSFYYKPNMIRVKKGEKVKLVMNSVDMMHNLKIDALKIAVPITKSGSSATAEFTATEAGTFEYYCSVGQHRANGQVGTLIVE